MFLYAPRKQPRGLRLNNPGNLKELPGDITSWKGERATDDDPIFEEFVDHFHGIRAMGRVLDSYQRRGVDTIEQIIHTYAPGIENDTESYIRAIERTTGFNRTDIIGRDRGNMPDLVAAMIHQEQGEQPFSKEFISAALAAA